MKEKVFFFCKNVSEPSNPPDELAQNVSKKNPFRTNYSSIFSAKVQNLAVFFIYLHDSNSIFRAAGINSEIFSARTVTGDLGTDTAAGGQRRRETLRGRIRKARRRRGIWPSTADHQGGHQACPVRHLSGNYDGTAATSRCPSAPVHFLLVA